MAENLKNSAVSGAIWTGLEKITTQVIHFVFGIILARLLAPSDYGIVGMLGIFMAIANTFTDSGMGSALIQKKDKTDEDYCTVFWFNMAVSAFFYVILFVTAPWIAEFYHMPILTDVTRVVALSLIIGASATVQRTRLTINLQFLEQSKISIYTMLFSGLLGITLAYYGWGVWALVAQSLLGALFSGVLIWSVVKWTPRFHFSKESFRQLFGFGSKILGSSLINTIYNNLTTLVVGRVYTPAEVGYYNRGDGYAKLPTQTIQEMIIKVNYPILAKLQDDNEALLRAYKKLLCVPMYILYPLLVGLAVTADPLISLMIGEKWLPCVPVMQILCVACMFRPLTHTNLNLLYVKGRSDLVLKLELIKKPIGFVLLIAAIPFGMLWMVAGQALYSFIAFAFNCYYTGKILGYGMMEQLKQLFPIFLNSFIMGVMVYIVMMFFDDPWLKMVVGTSAGIVSYLLYSIITKDTNYLQAKTIIRDKVLRK